MPHDLHSFIRDQLWLKLKSDIGQLYVTNRGELIAAAYFHIRRLLLVQPGWTCRVCTDDAGPHLLLHNQGQFRTALHCEFVIEQDSRALAEIFSSRMDSLFLTIHRLGRPADSRGYLVGVFDTAEPPFYPDEEAPETQACFWLPINCRDFPDYAAWHHRWKQLTANPARLCPSERVESTSSTREAQGGGP